MTFGEQIKQARENKNLSQEELATRLGVSRQAVSKWENGSSKPHGMNREMLFQVLTIEPVTEKEPSDQKTNNDKIGLLIGILILFVLIIGLFITQIPNNSSSTVLPTIKSITLTFYGCASRMPIF